MDSDFSRYWTVTRVNADLLLAHHVINNAFL